MRKISVFALLAVVVSVSSCVFNNNMSYPPLQGQIVKFKVEGEKTPATIDNNTQTVTVLLEETAEINALKVLEYEISEITVADVQLGEYIDLSEPMVINLDTYPEQSYRWVISAQQPIERYVKCSNLVEAVFNPKNQTILVAVTDKQPLENLVITDMKIGPETSEILSTTGGTEGSVIEDVEFPMTLDCTVDRTFTVLYKGEESVWTMTVYQKKLDKEITGVDAWAHRAYVTGQFDGQGEPCFEYCEEGTEDWKVVEDVVVNGAIVSGSISGLEDGTKYQVRLAVGEEKGRELSFTTETAAQLPGMGFDDWYYGGNNGKTWYPYAEDATEKIWDSANPGVSSLIENTTIPEYEHKVEGKAAAKLSSDLAVLKFAAGNVFTGKFISFADWVATLEWGVPFSSRPYSLKGWYDYSPAEVNRDEMNKFPEMLGKPDMMQIMVALVADGEGTDVGPFPVYSNKPGEPDLQNDPRIIAFGELISSESTDGKYVEFELPLTYKENDNRKPNNVIVVACSSYRGNFFTGAVGSVLYVDGFSFTYR